MSKNIGIVGLLGVVMVFGIFYFYYFGVYDESDNQGATRTEIVSTNISGSKQGTNSTATNATNTVSTSSKKQLTKLSEYNYTSDGENVYFKGRKLDGAELDTFKVIYDADPHWADMSVAKDYNHVFCGNKMLIGADPNTLKVSSVSGHLHEAFDLLEGNNSSFYDRNNFYYLNYGNNDAKDGCNNITTVDIGSFKHATSSYFYDKNDVYRNIEYIETALLVPLHANPKTFAYTGLSDWYRDDKNLFYVERKLENSDPDTFKLISNKYSKDKNQVYYTNRPFEGWTYATIVDKADPKTFEVLKDGWKFAFAKDINRVYFNNGIAEGIDSESVSVFPDIPDMIMDMNHLFVSNSDWNRLVPYELVDVDTFKIDIDTKVKRDRISGPVYEVYAHDKNNKYLISIGNNDYEYSKISVIK